MIHSKLQEPTFKMPKMKTAEFANSADQNEVAQNALPHLDLHCLMASRSTLGNSQYDTAWGQYFINPLYTGGLFHCQILNESICHFRGVRSIFLPYGKSC